MDRHQRYLAGLIREIHRSQSEQPADRYSAAAGKPDRRIGGDPSLLFPANQCPSQSLRGIRCASTGGACSGRKRQAAHHPGNTVTPSLLDPDRHNLEAVCLQAPRHLVASTPIPARPARDFIAGLASSLPGAWPNPFGSTPYNIAGNLNCLSRDLSEQPRNRIIKSDKINR